MRYWTLGCIGDERTRLVIHELFISKILVIVFYGTGVIVTLGHAKATKNYQEMTNYTSLRFNIL